MSFEFLHLDGLLIFLLLLSYFIVHPFILAVHGFSQLLQFLSVLHSLLHVHLMVPIGHLSLAHPVFLFELALTLCKLPDIAFKAAHVRTSHLLILLLGIAIVDPTEFMLGLIDTVLSFLELVDGEDYAKRLFLIWSLASARFSLVNIHQ